MLTGTIYLASMSMLLIACCYWKRANNWGALGAIIVGAVVPIALPRDGEDFPRPRSSADAIGQH